MSEQSKPGGNLVLLNALLDLLDMKENREVHHAVSTFRGMLKTMDPFASAKLLRMKMKQLVTVRDQVLTGKKQAEPVKQAEQTADKVPNELQAPIKEMIDRALNLLEGATNTSGAFTGDLNEAIEALKQARDIVSVNKLSKQIISSSNDMVQAGNRFQNNIGEIAHAMLDYQRKIEALEHEVENQKQIAQIDPLTKVMNRGAFDNRFKEVVEQAQRFNTSLCLLMLDVDRFKEINDSHGHQVGDDVLVSLADLLIKTAGPKNLVFRFGGDEFAVLFPNMNLGEAESIADDLQSFVEGRHYTYKDLAFNISISGGLTYLKPEDSRGSFFKRADLLLYRAKNKGRKQICSE